MADLINALVGKAKTKSKSSSKKDEVVWYPDKDLTPSVVELIEAGHISDILDPILASRKLFVVDKLFDIFCEKMWESKTLPDNPRIVIKKKNAEAKDMAFMFVVKFRKDAISKILPAPNELSEDQTPMQVLHKLLSSIGLSDENINKITDEDNGEFHIVNRLNLCSSFDSMYYGSDPVKKSAATKILSYINGGEISSITQEEQGILEVEQLLMVKENFLQRAFLYCENVEQLRSLLKFVKVSLVCQNYEFAVGDEPSERNKRIEKAVTSMLT